MITILYVILLILIIIIILITIAALFITAPSARVVRT